MEENNNPSITPDPQPPLTDNTTEEKSSQENSPLSQTPKRELTDEEVQSLLAINKLKPEDSQKGSPSFLVFVIAVTILVIGLSLIIQYRNGQGAKSTNSTSSSTSNPFNSNSTVNQQAQYCSNPINAQTSC